MNASIGKCGSGESCPDRTLLHCTPRFSATFTWLLIRSASTCSACTVSTRGATNVSECLTAAQCLGVPWSCTCTVGEAFGHGYVEHALGLLICWAAIALSVILVHYSDRSLRPALFYRWLGHCPGTLCVTAGAIHDRWCSNLQPTMDVETGVIMELHSSPYRTKCHGMSIACPFATLCTHYGRISFFNSHMNQILHF